MANVFPESLCAMLQNCQAAWEYLNSWEREFIESISLKTGPSTQLSLTAKQTIALMRTWNNLPAHKKDPTWRPDDEISDLRRHEELDKDIPF